MGQSLISQCKLTFQVTFEKYDFRFNPELEGGSERRVTVGEEFEIIPVYGYRGGRLSTTTRIIGTIEDYKMTVLSPSVFTLVHEVTRHAYISKGVRRYITEQFVQKIIAEYNGFAINCNVVDNSRWSGSTFEQRYNVEVTTYPETAAELNVTRSFTDDDYIVTVSKYGNYVQLRQNSTAVPGVKLLNIDATSALGYTASCNPTFEHAIVEPKVLVAKANMAYSNQDWTASTFARIRNAKLQLIFRGCSNPATEFQLSMPLKDGRIMRTSGAQRRGAGVLFAFPRLKQTFRSSITIVGKVDGLVTCHSQMTVLYERNSRTGYSTDDEIAAFLQQSPTEAAMGLSELKEYDSIFARRRASGPSPSTLAVNKLAELSQTYPSPEVMYAAMEMAADLHDYSLDDQVSIFTSVLTCVEAVVTSEFIGDRDSSIDALGDALTVAHAFASNSTTIPPNGIVSMLTAINEAAAVLIPSAALYDDESAIILALANHSISAGLTSEAIMITSDISASVNSTTELDVALMTTTIEAAPSLLSPIFALGSSAFPVATVTINSIVSEELAAAVCDTCLPQWHRLDNNTWTPLGAPFSSEYNLDGMVDFELEADVNVAYALIGVDVVRVPTCNNGVVEGDEECDPYNTAMTGCENCAITPGYVCAGKPSVCVPEGPETCRAPELVSGCIACMPSSGATCSLCAVDGHVPIGDKCVPATGLSKTSPVVPDATNSFQFGGSSGLPTVTLDLPAAVAALVSSVQFGVANPVTPEYQNPDDLTGFLGISFELSLLDANGSVLDLGILVEPAVLTVTTAELSTPSGYGAMIGLDSGWSTVESTCTAAEATAVSGGVLTFSTCHFTQFAIIEGGAVEEFCPLVPDYALGAFSNCNGTFVPVGTRCNVLCNNPLYSAVNGVVECNSTSFTWPTSLCKIDSLVIPEDTSDVSLPCDETNPLFPGCQPCEEGSTLYPDCLPCTSNHTNWPDCMECSLETVDHPNYPDCVVCDENSIFHPNYPDCVACTIDTPTHPLYPGCVPCNSSHPNYPNNVGCVDCTSNNENYPDCLPCDLDHPIHPMYPGCVECTDNPTHPNYPDCEPCSSNSTNYPSCLPCSLSTPEHPSYPGCVECTLDTPSHPNYPDCVPCDLDSPTHPNYPDCVECTLLTPTHPNYPDCVECSVGTPTHPGYPGCMACNLTTPWHPEYPGCVNCTLDTPTHPNYPDCVTCTLETTTHPNYPDCVTCTALTPTHPEYPGCTPCTLDNPDHPDFPGCVNCTLDTPEHPNYPGCVPCDLTTPSHPSYPDCVPCNLTTLTHPSYPGCVECTLSTPDHPWYPDCVNCTLDTPTHPNYPGCVKCTLDTPTHPHYPDCVPCNSTTIDHPSYPGCWNCTLDTTSHPYYPGCVECVGNSNHPNFPACGDCLESDPGYPGCLPCDKDHPEHPNYSNCVTCTLDTPLHANYPDCAPCNLTTLTHPSYPGCVECTLSTPDHPWYPDCVNCTLDTPTHPHYPGCVNCTLDTPTHPDYPGCAECTLDTPTHPNYPDCVPCDLTTPSHPSYPDCAPCNLTTVLHPNYPGCVECTLDTPTHPDFPGCVNCTLDTPTHPDYPGCVECTLDTPLHPHYPNCVNCTLDTPTHPNYPGCVECTLSTPDHPGYPDCVNCTLDTPTHPNYPGCVECTLNTTTHPNYPGCVNCTLDTPTHPDYPGCVECTLDTPLHPNYPDCVECNLNTTTHPNYPNCAPCNLNTTAHPNYPGCVECTASTPSHPGYPDCLPCDSNHPNYPACESSADVNNAEEDPVIANADESTLETVAPIAGIGLLAVAAVAVVALVVVGGKSEKDQPTEKDHSVRGVILFATLFFFLFCFSLFYSLCQR